MTEAGIVTGREIAHLDQFTPQMVTATIGGPFQNQKPEIASGPSTLVAGAQILGPSSTFF